MLAFCNYADNIYVEKYIKSKLIFYFHFAKPSFCITVKPLYSLRYMDAIFQRYPIPI